MSRDVIKDVLESTAKSSPGGLEEDTPVFLLAKNENLFKFTYCCREQKDTRCDGT